MYKFWSMKKRNDRAQFRPKAWKLKSIEREARETEEGLYEDKTKTSTHIVEIYQIQILKKLFERIENYEGKTT